MRPMRRQIERATAKALGNIDQIFVAVPASRPHGSCLSCGELRTIVDHTGMCDECSEVAYQMYPDTRP